MIINRKLPALTIGVLAMFAAPVFAGDGARSSTPYWPFFAKQRDCPVRKIADGSLVNCYGWRKWGGSMGWDKTCLKLDYLPSQFACSKNFQ
jgi:hypothetical protein